MDSETTEPISTIFGTNVRWVHETVYHKFYQNPYQHFSAIEIFVFHRTFGLNRAPQNQNKELNQEPLFKRGLKINDVPNEHFTTRYLATNGPQGQFRASII